MEKYDCKSNINEEKGSRKQEKRKGKNILKAFTFMCRNDI